jgi:hypothetical protein
LVIDVEALEEAEAFHELYTKRIKAEEVIPVAGKGTSKFLLPLVDGTVKQPGPDQKREVSRQRRSSAEEDEELEEKDEPEAAAEEAEAPQPVPSDEGDFWSLNSYALTRHHPNGRIKLFTFEEMKDKIPIPLKFIDVGRRTVVSEGDDSYEVNDTWYNEHDSGVDPQREMKEMWHGKTEFPLLKPAAKAGYKWCSGRLTKIQETTRPDQIWPELWDRYSKKQRVIVIKKWREVDEIEDAARKHRGIHEIAPEDVDTSNKVLADISKKLEPEAVPCMPVITHEMKLEAVKAAATKKKGRSEFASREATTLLPERVATRPT